MSEAETLWDARFKVLGSSRQSHHGGTGTWRKNEWRSVEGPVVPCSNGIHYCKPEHLVQWLGPTIWLFEDGTPDETIDHCDKLVTRKGRIIRQMTTWNETTARLFAADCAEEALRFIPGDHQGPFVAAIRTARGFARGEVSGKERAAAGVAAWAAARAAEGAAEGAAARDHQTAVLFEYLSGERP